MSLSTTSTLVDPVSGSDGHNMDEPCISLSNAPTLATEQLLLKRLEEKERENDLLRQTLMKRPAPDSDDLVPNKKVITTVGPMTTGTEDSFDLPTDADDVGEFSLMLAKGKSTTGLLPPVLRNMALAIDKHLQSYQLAVIVQFETQLPLQHGRSPAHYKMNTDKKCTVSNYDGSQRFNPNLPVVKQWTVKRTVCDYLNNKQRDSGWSVMNFFSAMGKSLDTVDVIMVAHHAPHHYHVHALLLSNNSEMRNAQILRGLAKSKIRGEGTHVKRFITTNPGWWFLHAAEDRAESLYMGSSCMNLHHVMINCNQHLKKLVAQGEDIHDIPDCPIGETEEITEELDADVVGMFQDDLNGPSGGKPVEVCKRIAKSVKSRTDKASIAMGYVLRLKPTNADREHLMSLVYDLPTEHRRVMEYFLSTPYYERLFMSCLDEYFRAKIRRPLVAVCQESFTINKDDVSSVRLYLEEQTSTPLWSVIIYNALVCLHGVSKRNTLYVWEANGDSGKTMWLNSGMQWATPTVSTRIDLSEHRFEALAYPHRLCIIDDNACVITGQIEQECKMLLGGTMFEVNPKYRSRSYASPSPVFYLNNKPFFTLQVLSGESPFRNRCHIMHLDGRNHALPTLFELPQINLFWRWACYCYNQTLPTGSYIDLAPPQWMLAVLDLAAFDVFTSRVCRSSPKEDDQRSVYDSMYINSDSDNDDNTTDTEMLTQETTDSL